MKSEGLDFLQGPDTSETLELCGEAAVSFWVAGKLLCRQAQRDFKIIKVKVKVTQSCSTVCNPMDYTVHGILQARILGWGSLSLLQGIFPTQGSNPGFPHCRRILYQLSHREAQEYYSG